MTKGTPMDQETAIAAYRAAWNARESARDEEVRAEFALDGAKRVLADAERAVEDAHRRLDLALCGQERRYIEREMAAVNDRAFRDLATQV